MPKPEYNDGISTDLYTSMYEQYYFKNSVLRKVKPIKKKKLKNKNIFFKKIISFTFVMLLLFWVLPYSFKNFEANLFPVNTKKALRVDYKNLLYPTYSYLYKDLFLGKYIIKEVTYKNHLMVDIQESFERKSLKNGLLNLMEHYKRIKPSVYVWEYNGKSFVNINADEPFPAASIIKIPVLIEMFREIEQGKFTLDDTMVLEDYYRAPGSGKLQYSQGGVAHSMDYLAKIMIENSDNSSTNMIMAKMGGMPEVNKAMNKWGLKTTHINTWLPDLEGTNITTAREMAKMFYNIDSTNILSSDSKKHIADYLGHVKNNRLLQAGLPHDAILLHKTGDIGFMLGDAGIVKTANGKKYIVVILARRPYNNLQGKEFIVKASKIIYNNISN
ncbi:MAG: class A beta-lactamase-related serine hydrolase [Candidatus Gastranaerophilales bacterium]|nr:class A beta-lactamase-related serine hydrolase [Candidatus Gastranaerophilales bacterium]